MTMVEKRPIATESAESPLKDKRKSVNVFDIPRQDGRKTVFDIEKITEKDEEVEQSENRNKEVDSDVILSSSSDEEIPQE